MNTLTVRWPDLHFENSLPHWNAEEPEFSQINNAASTVLPHLEPYLIKVLRSASQKLNSEHDQELLAGIDLFIRQEANHYKMHQKFNAILHSKGYLSVKQHEERLADDYRDFLANRSLKFNLAYSEGFESMGLVQAEFIFKHAEHWLRNSDDQVRDLWEWHLAEEYEHRRICFDVYQRLYGGYFYRLYGLFCAVRHLNGYGKRVGKFLISLDRDSGKIDDDWRSRWREQRYRIKLSAYGMVKLLRVLSPFYNPARLSVPEAATIKLYDTTQKDANRLA